MLQTIPIFAGLSEEELALIEQRAVSRSYPKGSMVIREGEEAISLYLIISGAVKIFMDNEEGKEIILNTQGPGEHFGELALVDDQPRSASVMTTQQSKFMVITKQQFKDVLTHHPDIAIGMIKNLSRRVRLLSDNVKSLALLDVYGRLAKTLLILSKEKDGKLVIEEKLTQQDIANRIGSSREMVARILKDLVTGGYISIDNKHITINEKLPQAY